MPTETFMNLSKEKQRKIIHAAKKEFARVSLPEVSIKNIVEEAGIARGSFYQYFETKEELLQYITQSGLKELEENMKKIIESTKGDIFEVFLSIYDKMIEKCFSHEDGELYRNILMNLKASQGTLFEKMHRNKKDIIQEYIHLVDTSKLKIEKEQDLDTIFHILYALTRVALTTLYRYPSREEAREEYQKQLEYIKYGIAKQNE